MTTVPSTEPAIAATAASAATAATGVWSVARDVRLAGLLTFIQAAQSMTVMMLGASMAPGYDVRGGAISDLGVIAQTAVLFNASLILTGALNLAVGVLLSAQGRAGRWLTVVFVIAGIGALGAGLVPLDRGGLHGLFALGAFVAFNLQALGSSRLVAGPLRAVGLVSGVLGLLFVALMVVGDAGDPAVFGPIGHGGAERMIVYPAMLWLLTFGGALMVGAPRRDERPLTPTG